MQIIECPRCGMEQPRDRYCASCGVDMEKLLAKPKPLVIRILQNPNFHLSLIGLLIVMVAGYILYTQSAVMTRQVARFLDLPISSRDAADPYEADAAADALTENASAHQDDALQTAASEMTLQETAAPAPAPSEETTIAQPPVKPVKNLKLAFLEVPHETIVGVVQVAEKLSEGTAGRGYLFPNGTGIAESLKKAGRKLGRDREAALQAGAQVVVETPPTAAEAFQFGLLAQQSKWDGKNGQVRLEVSLVLPQPETASEASQPTMRQVIEAGLSSSAAVTGTAVILVVIEPPHRQPREEFLNRAGEGPWSVFASEAFRAGDSHWVAVIYLE